MSRLELRLKRELRRASAERPHPRPRQTMFRSSSPLFGWIECFCVVTMPPWPSLPSSFPLAALFSHVHASSNKQGFAGRSVLRRGNPSMSPVFERSSCPATRCSLSETSFPPTLKPVVALYC